MSVDFNAWTYTWCMICTVWAAYPCLSWSAVAMRANPNPWVVFIPWASFTPTLRSRSSPSSMRQRAGHIACTKLPKDIQSSWMHSFKIYGIWPQTDRHIYIHTTSANAVTLVWGIIGACSGSPQLCKCTLPKRLYKHCILYKLYWREGLSKIRSQSS